MYIYYIYLPELNDIIEISKLLSIFISTRYISISISISMYLQFYI